MKLTISELYEAIAELEMLRADHEARADRTGDNSLHIDLCDAVEFSLWDCIDDSDRRSVDVNMEVCELKYIVCSLWGRKKPGAQGNERRKSNDATD